MQLLSLTRRVCVCVCVAGIVSTGDEDEAEGPVEKANGEV